MPVTVGLKKACALVVRQEMAWCGIAGRTAGKWQPIALALGRRSRAVKRDAMASGSVARLGVHPSVQLPSSTRIISRGAGGRLGQARLWGAHEQGGCDEDRAQLTDNTHEVDAHRAWSRPLGERAEEACERPAEPLQVLPVALVGPLKARHPVGETFHEAAPRCGGLHLSPDF